MILVDIDVPMMGIKYDFQMEETALLTDVIEEVRDMICQKEQCFLSGDGGRLLLWNMENGQKLSPERTVSENHLLTGSHLMLI
ncbi:MAG: hypothetical protein PHN80_10735 [Hespellia sp.]|nr:hypothetical protein [Hespellia sp.]